MSEIVAQLTPILTCSCGTSRDFTSPAGLPPPGYETMCLRNGCPKTWRLLSIDTDTMTGVESWLWVDFPDPERAAAVKEANALARTLIGIDEALRDIGLFAGPARGMA
jgi:hypothetical protein